jgi:hypothetical protein
MVARVDKSRLPHSRSKQAENDRGLQRVRPVQQCASRRRLKASGEVLVFLVERSWEKQQGALELDQIRRVARLQPPTSNFPTSPSNIRSSYLMQPPGRLARCWLARVLVVTAASCRFCLGFSCRAMVTTNLSLPCSIAWHVLKHSPLSQRQMPPLWI